MKRFSISGVSLFFTMILFGSSVKALEASTLHAIYILDLQDKKIGGYVADTFGYTETLLKDAAKSAGMDYKSLVVSKGNFNASFTKDALEQYKASPNDMIFVLYNGHGFNMGMSRWPNFVLTDGDLGLNETMTILEKKNVRFLMVIAESCNITKDKLNADIDSGNLTRPRTTRPGYRKMFAEFRGKIIASSSVKEEYSFGGLYLNQFLLALKEGGDSENPDWKTIMDNASRPILVTSALQKNQTPQYELHHWKSNQPITNVKVDSQGKAEEIYPDWTKTNQAREKCIYVFQLAPALKNFSKEVHEVADPGRNQVSWTRYKHSVEEFDEIANYLEDKEFSSYIKLISKAVKSSTWSTYRTGVRQMNYRIQNLDRSCRAGKDE